MQKDPAKSYVGTKPGVYDEIVWQRWFCVVDDESADNALRMETFLA